MTAPAPLASTLPATDLQVFLTVLGQLGYHTETLLAAAGLGEESFRHPDARIACEAYSAIFGRAQQERYIANLGLELARVTPLGAWPLLDYLVLTSETVGAVVQQLARYFRLTGSPVGLATREDDDPIEIELTAISSFAIKYLAALMLLYLRQETEGRFVAHSLSFTHAPDDPGGFERVLGCPLRSQAASNRVIVSAAAWRLSLRRRDPVLRQMLERHADAILERLPQQTGVASDVQRALAARVAGGDTRVHSGARELRTSTRTLQRRLAEEGVTYQSLVDRARKEAASRYLSNSNLTIGEVAYLVGFSEPAPFYRAFRRWFAVTPERFRTQQRETASA